MVKYIFLNVFKSIKEINSIVDNNGVKVQEQRATQGGKPDLEFIFSWSFGSSQTIWMGQLQNWNKDWN